MGTLPGPVRPLKSAAEWAERRRWWLFALVGLLYAAAYGTHWRIDPDSGNYLLVAQSLAAGEGFVHPTGRHSDMAPGFPWLLAAVMWVFGPQTWWAINALVLGIGLGNLALCYWLFSLHCGRANAVVVTLLVAITQQHLELCLVPLADVPFLSGLLLTLVGLERLHARRRFPALSLLLALGGVVIMGLMRSVVITAVGAVILGVGWDLLRARRFGVLAGGGLLAAAGLILVRLLGGGAAGLSLNPDERLMIRRLTEELPAALAQAASGNAYELFCVRFSRSLVGIDMGPWVNLPIGLFIFAAGLLLVRRRTAWGLLVGAFVLQWLLFIVAPRYFLAIVPLLCFGCWDLARRFDDRYVRRWPSVPTFVFMLFWPIAALCRDALLVIEQRHPRFAEVQASGRYAGLEAIAGAVRERVPPDAVLLSDSFFVNPLMLWTGRPTHHALDRAVLDAPVVFAVTPLESGPAAALEQMGWTLGPALAEAGRPGKWPALALRAVVRPGGRGADAP